MKLQGEKYVDFWKQRMARGPLEAGFGGMGPSDVDAQAECFHHLLRMGFAIVRPPAAVLEFGSGYGRMLRRTRAYWPAAMLTGLELCDAAALGSWKDWNCRIICSAGIPPSIAGGSQNVVYSCTALQHVTDDQVFEAVCRDMIRVLGFEGHLVLLENTSKPGADHVRDMSADDYQAAFGRGIEWWPGRGTVLSGGQEHTLLVGRKI